MRLKKHRYITIAAFVVLLTVASIAFARTSASLAASGNKVAMGQTLPGLAPSIKGLTPLNTTASDKQLNLSISLNLRNADALNALITAQNDPASSSYHHYLTPQEFEQSFAPTQATVQSVTSYLQSQGIQVASVAPNRLLIDATGTVANAEKAFNVTIANYALHGRSVFSPTTNPSIPASLNTMISNIAGLDNVAHYHYNSQVQRTAPHLGPAGGYTPSELRTAYDINPLISNGDNGTGQTVAIFELDGYQPSDINAYLSNYGLGGAKYSNVLVDGVTNTAGDGAIEVELDMETVSAIAPSATQKIYIGPNSNTGVNDTYNQIVSDDTAKVVSTSWGECEADSGTSELTALDTIFKQAATQGQAIFAASGDAGAYDCGTTSLGVDSPADDPNVVGVGGTSLTTGTGGTYQSEIAWSDPSNTNPGPTGAGSGGGYSTQFTRPGYQTGTNLTNANREVPDVSADADPNTGYSVYCTVAVSDCGSGWLVVGGTSAAAPLWAALATDVNQYLAVLSQPTLGSASTAIYTLYNTSQTYSAYHDVTSGNNLHFTATAGYDVTTGIGTPDAWNFARDLASASTGGGGGNSSLLSNGGFEGGSLSWMQASNGGYQLVNSLHPHTGSQSADLCGYSSCNDTLYQTVTLPATLTSATLSYWTYIDTQDAGSTTCSDTLSASIRTATGSTITTVQAQCNTDIHGWTQYTFDVTANLGSYVGQKVKIFFQGTTKAATSSDFYIDDVAFAVA
jgi:subtilase family serine protease